MASVGGQEQRPGLPVPSFPGSLGYHLGYLIKSTRLLRPLALGMTVEGVTHRCARSGDPECAVMVPSYHSRSEKSPEQVGNPRKECSLLPAPRGPPEWPAQHNVFWGPQSFLLGTTFRLCGKIVFCRSPIGCPWKVTQHLWAQGPQDHMWMALSGWAFQQLVTDILEAGHHPAP